MIHNIKLFFQFNSELDQKGCLQRYALAGNSVNLSGRQLHFTFAIFFMAILFSYYQSIPAIIHEKTDSIIFFTEKNNICK